MSGIILKWGNPQAFYLLLAVVIFCALYFFFEKWSQIKLQKAFGAKVSAYLTQSVSLARRRGQLFVQVLGLVFIIVALARPQAGESQQEIRSEGVEILILADVSDSMLAEDVRPSRLAALKIELGRMLDLMPGNKIGIIAFAGSSVLLSPLTSDPNALRMYIDSLDTYSVSSQGTNVEGALTAAKDAFEKGGVTQDESARSTRVILVASDGEDQEKGALEAAKSLAKDGVRIFTIAYGTEKGAGIPTRDRYGNMTGFKKDSGGQPVVTTVKGDFLRELASVGSGQFYFSSFEGDHLRKFVDDLNTLEKTQFQSSLLTQYDEKFTAPLLLGLLLIVASFFISDRKVEGAGWKGKYETGA